MIGFLYRTYSEARGPFYNGDSATLPKTMDVKEAQIRRADHDGLFETIEVKLPAKKHIQVEIPVKKEDANHIEDSSFEEKILSDVRIDPKIRIICNKILQRYMFCAGGFFVARPGGYHDKMNTKNMEILQLMKDVIMGYVRYDPIQLDYFVGKGAKKQRIEYERDICEDLKNKTYIVGGKKYKTDIYGVYTRILRKSMFQHKFKFYGNHELQYLQRRFDLNYGAMNYWCSSRFSGKTMYGVFNNLKVLFKSATSLEEFSDKRLFKSHFFVTSLGVVEDYQKNLKEFFYNLLVKTYQLSEEAANQIVEWKSSKNTMYLHTSEGSRPFEFVSELASSKRGERSGMITLDEANYLKKYEEASGFAAASLAGTVNQISTISKDSKSTLFYKNRVREMLKMRKAMPIDEVIHRVRVKFGFDKLTSREDYRAMAESGQLEKARAYYYKLRPTFAMKATLDDIEWMSDEVKQVKIDQSIASVNGYDGMLAEYYCELLPSTSAINYRANIIDEEKIPSRFEKIFAGYDEAESGDEATMVITGINNKKLYVLDAQILPKQVGKRYVAMTGIINKRATKSGLNPSIIVDIGRGNIYFRETSNNVPFVDMAIKARAGKFEKIEQSQGISFYSVGTELLVQDIMNVELIGADKIFFSSGLSGNIEIQSPEGVREVDGLFGQLDNYIIEGKTYKGKGKKPDDLVSALLYASYFAYNEGLKQGAVLESKGTTDKIEVFDAQFQSKQKELASLTRRPKKSIRSMR